MSAKHQTPAAFDDDEIKSIWSQQATAELQDSEPTRSWAAVDEKQKKAAESPGWGNRTLPLHHPLLDGAEWSVWQTGSECGTLIRSLTGGSWQLLQLTTECQTPCKNKVSLSKERMKPSWTRFLLRQPITAPHFELCPRLVLQSWFPPALTGSCLWGGDRWLTDPGVLSGRCQTRRHVAYTVTRACITHAHTHTARIVRIVPVEANSTCFNNSVNELCFSCMCSLQQRQ